VLSRIGKGKSIDPNAIERGLNSQLQDKLRPLPQPSPEP